MGACYEPPTKPNQKLAGENTEPVHHHPHAIDHILGIY